MNLRRSAAASILALVFAVGLSACGNAKETSSGRATAEPGVPDGAAFIDQDNLKFSPTELTISASEPVYFKNSESTLHTVTINGENESGQMEHDRVFEWTPPAPGEYKITCDFHPQMKATIKVE